MVAVGMGNDGACYRSPGVDIKPAPGAVKAFIGKFDERHGGEKIQYLCLLRKGRFWGLVRKLRASQAFRSIHLLDNSIRLLDEVQFFIFEIFQREGLVIEHGLDIEVGKYFEFFFTDAGYKVAVFFYE